LYNIPLNVALLCKNANPKPAHFAHVLNPGFGFSKVSGFPRAPGFSKPRLQSL